MEQRAEKLASVADIVAAHQQAFKATQDARCWLNLLIGPATPDATDLKICADQVVDVSFLNVTFPAVLDPDTCNVAPASPHPGDEAWALAQYQSEDWFSNVQAVTPCTAQALLEPLPL